MAEDAQAIAKMAKTEQADLVVLGYPLEETGEEGKAARIAQMLKTRLGEMGFDVRLVDERYTSVRADANLRDQTETASGRRKLKDGEAARLILEAFWREQA